MNAQDQRPNSRALAPPLITIHVVPGTGGPVETCETHEQQLPDTGVDALPISKRLACEAVVVNPADVAAVTPA